jgi:hypothetical protein
MYGGEQRSAYSVLVGKPEGKDHLEVLGVGGRIILKRIFKKSFGFRGLGLSGSG